LYCFDNAKLRREALKKRCHEEIALLEKGALHHIYTWPLSWLETGIFSGAAFTDATAKRHEAELVASA